MFKRGGRKKWPQSSSSLPRDFFGHEFAIMTRESSVRDDGNGCAKADHPHVEEAAPVGSCLHYGRGASPERSSTGRRPTTSAG